MGLQPDGDPPAARFDSASGSNSRAAAHADFTLREALRTSAFWFITAATAIRVIILGAVNVHYVALMGWTGMSP
jgi:uncharacterized membrane protein